MGAREDLFRHIVSGDAGGAAPLLARAALCLGHDSSAFNLDLQKLTQAGSFTRDPVLCGATELLLASYVEASLLGSLVPWTESQARALVQLAEPSKARPSLALLSGGQSLR